MSNTNLVMISIMNLKVSLQMALYNIVNMDAKQQVEKTDFLKPTFTFTLKLYPIENIGSEFFCLC